MSIGFVVFMTNALFDEVGKTKSCFQAKRSWKFKCESVSDWQVDKFSSSEVGNQPDLNTKTNDLYLYACLWLSHPYLIHEKF